MGPLTEVFLELIRMPFHRPEMIWGIVPLYFSWVVSEATSPRATYATSIQTGFALLWAGVHWAWDHRGAAMRAWGAADPGRLPAVTTAVTLLVLLLGTVALWSGLRRRYPRGMRFLGHIRFSAYFMIAIFPIQAGALAWTWDRFFSVALFALPVWLAVHLLFWPLRR